MKIHILGAFLAVTLAACAHSSGETGREGEADEITIAFDPASDDPDGALAEAQAHCAGFGKTAIFVDETIDPDGRLRHRHYHCR